MVYDEPQFNNQLELTKKLNACIMELNVSVRYFIFEFFIEILFRLGIYFEQLNVYF